MSSMYTRTFPVSIRSHRSLFIIVWNVAGELVSPKNITRGSNNPLLVRNAAFHSSPSLIRTLLYPHCTSSLVKYLAPFSLFTSS